MTRQETSTGWVWTFFASIGSFGRRGREEGGDWMVKLHGCGIRSISHAGESSLGRICMNLETMRVVLMY